MTGIEIPSKINYIGKNAFFGCLLTEIRYNAVNCTTLDMEDDEDGVFSSCTFIIDNIEDYWEIIEKNEGYAKVTVGAKVKSIPANLFSGRYVTEVEFEEGSLCESIGEEAFYYSSLSTVNLEACESLKSIGAEAFYNCSLTELTIPSNVENIGRSAFSRCSSLTAVKYNARYARLDEEKSSIFEYSGGYNMKITIGADVWIIPDYCFKDSNVTELVFDCEYQHFGIGTYAFSGTEIETVRVSEKAINNIRSVGYRAFYACPLKNIYFSGDINEWAIGYLPNYMMNASDEDKNFYVNDELVTEVNLTTATFICNYAFYGCASIKSVTLSKNLTRIGVNAFYGCKALKTVTISDDTTQLGAGAFEKCDSLDTVYYEGNANDWVKIENLDDLTNEGAPSKTIYMGGSLATEISITEATEIPDYAFRGFKDLKKANIFEQVTSIGKDAFSGCSALTEITLPFVGSAAGDASKVKYGSPYMFGYVFGQNAYDGGTATEQSYESGSSIYKNTYYIPKNIEKVTILGGDVLYGAFSNCKSLKNIVFGDGVTSVGGNACLECDNLTEITFGSAVTSIGKEAFKNCTKIETVSIPSNVRSVGLGAFIGCSGITEMTVPFIAGGEDKTSYTDRNSQFGYIFGEYYSNGINGDIYFYIPDGLKKVTVTGGDVLYGAFKDCEFIEDISILADSESGIGRYAFYNCSSLKNLTLPNKMTGKIDEYAFYNCSSLTSITIPDGVTSIGDQAFYGCDGLEKIYFNGDINGWVRISNLIKLLAYGADSKELYIGGELLTEANITAEVSIQPYAFYKYDLLTKVTIGDNVTSIGKYTFNGCDKLTSVTVGVGVTSIGYRAFNGCVKLTDVSFGESSKLNSFGDYAFDGCTALTEITIPSGVTVLSEYLFNGCSSLSTVTVATKTKTIYKTAFYGCDALSKVCNIDYNKNWRYEMSIYDYPGTNINFTANATNNAWIIKNTACYRFTWQG